jgi:hypothetical protein
MSAAGASGGPEANAIPSTMGALRQEEAGDITNNGSEDGDASPKGASTPDNASSQSEKGHGENDETTYLQGDEEEQEGARQMTAITTTWDKKTLITVYVL